MNYKKTGLPKRVKQPCFYLLSLFYWRSYFTSTPVVV